MTMTDVKVAELKARLSEYLHRVRRGHVVTVLHRDTPIARLIPYEQSGALKETGPLGRVAGMQQVPLPPPLDLELDVVELLAEERQGER